VERSQYAVVLMQQELLYLYYALAVLCQQQGSLEGQCFVVMIVAVSPCSNTYEDSLNALKYANRAKEIRVRCPSKVSTFTQDNRCNNNAALTVVSMSTACT
jgi:Kinesin motor domain